MRILIEDPMVMHMILLALEDEDQEYSYGLSDDGKELLEQLIEQFKNTVSGYEGSKDIFNATMQNGERW